MTATSIARSGRVTAVWYDGHVISAWYQDTGDPASLFKAHALTASPRARGDPMSPQAVVNPAACEHGLPLNVCMVCGARPDGGLVGG